MMVVILKSRKALLALLLGVTLALPSIVLADHLHDNLKDEQACELCAMQSTATPAEDLCPKQTTQDKTRQSGERPYLPFEIFRLGERARGPPLH